jgi:hypothetical protein
MAEVLTNAYPVDCAPHSNKEFNLAQHEIGRQDEEDRAKKGEEIPNR